MEENIKLGVELSEIVNTFSERVMEGLLEDEFPLLPTIAQFSTPGCILLDSGKKYTSEEYLTTEILPNSAKNGGYPTKFKFTALNRVEQGGFSFELAPHIITRLAKKKDVFNSLEPKVGYRWACNSFKWQPSRAFTGWHSNNDMLGTWACLVWAEEAEKSFFRYQNRDTGEICTHMERAGWQLHEYELLRKPFWHCSHTDTNRIVIAFHRRTVEDDAILQLGQSSSEPRKRWNLKQAERED